ncbi:murein hydrolase activator EnvC family protein [Microbacterium sp.]|uniref:murein hydrolase activator EnvC family protein n=1 Tax=Microbacterium sp. TaxID=51671 RepID=UPI003A894DED
MWERAAIRPAVWAAGIAVAAVVLCGLGPALAWAADAERAAGRVGAVDEHPRWLAPVEGAVVEPFRAPAHAYGPGHRGVDLAATEGAVVRSPAAGVVAFQGSVAGRGVLTIDHGDGYVTTLEPVAEALAAGTTVSAGDPVAVVASGGHAAAGTLHVGVRLWGEYLNPLLLFGVVARAVLLPCC